MLICDAAVTAWLARVNCGSLRCTGPLCAVATLSGHPLLTLSLAAGSLVALVILAFLTRAFTIGTAPVLAGSGGSLLVAAAAVVGAVALVLLALLRDGKRDPADRPAAGAVAGADAGSA